MEIFSMSIQRLLNIFLSSLDLLVVNKCLLNQPCSHDVTQLNQSLEFRKFFISSFVSSLSVDSLVKKWSPLVWLAPNEKYRPGSVKTFLSHVHAEREKKGSNDIKDIGDNLSQYYQNDGFEDLIYYEGIVEPLAGTLAAQNNRKRRNFEKETSLEHIFELPIDDASENWFLVTNEELGKTLR